MNESEDTAAAEQCNADRSATPSRLPCRPGRRRRERAGWGRGFMAPIRIENNERNENRAIQTRSRKRGRPARCRPAGRLRRNADDGSPRNFSFCRACARCARVAEVCFGKRGQSSRLHFCGSFEKDACSPAVAAGGEGSGERSLTSSGTSKARVSAVQRRWHRGTLQGGRARAHAVTDLAVGTAHRHWPRR